MRYVIPKIERIQQDRLVVVIYIQATPQAPASGVLVGIETPVPPGATKIDIDAGKLRTQAVFAGIFGDDRRSDAAKVRRFATGGASREGILSGRVSGEASTGSTRYHDDSIRSASSSSSFTGGGASAEANCLLLIGGRQRRDSESADSTACQYWWYGG